MDKKLRGRTGYQDGLAAEETACRHYLGRGYDLAASRWRGRSGEIDLVFRANGTVVCVEVKKAKSFYTAAHKLSPRQLGRIAAAATEFVAKEPNGQLTPLRIDLALVDMHGACTVIENVTLQ